MMISSATAASEWFLNGVANLNQQITKTDEELSSGYQVQDASDSPAQTPALVELGSQLATVQDYQTNLTRVQAEAEGADEALGSAITSINSALTLGAEGANSSNSAATDQTLAGQIQSIQQQVVSLANTTVAGRYIFGGSADQSAPYQYDAESATGVDQLTVSSANEVFVNPAGQTIYQPLTAQQIFAPVDANGVPTAGNTFAALQNLETALTNNDPAGIATAITALQGASGYLNQQQSYYGASEQQITAEQNNAANQSTALQAQIGQHPGYQCHPGRHRSEQESIADGCLFGAKPRFRTKSLFDYLG